MVAGGTLSSHSFALALSVRKSPGESPAGVSPCCIAARVGWRASRMRRPACGGKRTPYLAR
jgi:hypothetical protein